MTIDEYIERRRESFTPNKMNQVRSLLPALSFKALQADIEGRYNLVIHIDTL